MPCNHRTASSTLGHDLITGNHDRRHFGQQPFGPPAEPLEDLLCHARYGAKVAEGESMKQVLIGARVKPVLELEGVRFRDLNGNGVLDPYEDWRLSAAERAADLVSRMTPEEKIGLMVINSRTMGISQPDREFASHAGTLDEQCHRI
jgi:hypothetical protein